MNRFYIPPKEAAFDTKILARISEDNAAQGALKKQNVSVLVITFRTAKDRCTANILRRKAC